MLPEMPAPPETINEPDPLVIDVCAEVKSICPTLIDVTEPFLFHTPSVVFH